LGRTFAGKDFVEFSIDHHLTEIPAGTAQPEDFVIYFDESGFKHIGLLGDEGRVVSKWGTGLLLEHGLWEVPSAYGDHIRYFDGLDRGQAFEAFICYAESNGFQFDR